MTNLENLKKLAENLGADASGAETNAEAIGVVAEAAAEINDKMRTAESSISAVCVLRQNGSDKV